MTRDLRKYASQTSFRLVIGALILLFSVGAGLIYLFYGFGAAVMGLLCLTGALLPIGLIVLLLQFLDWIVKRGNND
jgi:glucose-6-phosphate-specific signal transduction histidine kinase